VAEELEGQEKPKKKGKLKWIIILLVLLLGLGAGGYFLKDTILSLIGMGDPAQEEPQPTPEERAAAPDFQG
jgi:flagellar basal body-associated protein FliL